jgi:hypothetical protein
MNGTSVMSMLRARWPWLIGCFGVVTIVSWFILELLVSPTYLSAGLVELGYFNPRDYQPHPVTSTRGVAALVNDPSFSARVAAELRLRPGGISGAFQLGSAPLEEGLVRVEARAATSRAAQDAAAVACSMVVSITGEDYRRERALINSQLELVRQRSALTESLIQANPTARGREALQGDALRALALLTEIQMEKETEAELVSQKKPSVIVVNPGPGIEERPSAVAMALGPALVVSVLLSAVFLARESGGEPQI